MAPVLVVNEQKSWEKSGKSEFLKFCRSQVEGKKYIEDGTSEEDIKRGLYEIGHCVMKGSLKLEHAVSLFHELSEIHSEIPSLLADVFSIIDLETNADEEKALREKFIAFLSACAGSVPDNVLKERLDAETLEKAQVLDPRTNFQGKYVKIKTRLYYKQQKFNLLREENEGYAKLITELNQDLENVSSERVLEIIRSLIGCFNLDPNRALDIILESFECRSDQDSFFVPLLRAYTDDKDTLCQILGFKFHFYQSDPNGTPQSLYKVAALLLREELIDLNALYAHLAPGDPVIVEQHQKEIQDAKKYAQKNVIVSFSSSDKKEDKEDKEKDKIDATQDNQKLGVCEAVLRIGDWVHAKAILDRLPPFCFASNANIAQAICRFVHHIIEPLYVQNSGMPSLVMKKRKSCTVAELKNQRQVKNFVELSEDVFPMLRYLGPHLSCDAVLMGKLLRLARAFMQKRADKTDPDLEEVFRGYMTLMDEVFLPSLSLLPGNCCIAEELWTFLKMLKYEHRYRLYGQWKNDTYGQHPKLLRSKADCIEKAKYIMKRLAKENVKPLGRQIGKLSHSNPAILFEYILTQIQKYDNFIGPVVDSLKYLTNLSYDMLAYCIIEALANPERERLKHDDTNISMWLQSLASFSGAIFKKYQIELAGLIQYVVNQLKAGKSYDLLILREVVQKMAGIEISEEVTDDQLLAIAGGEFLKQEGGYFAQVRNTKKSSSRLRDALIEHDLAIPLCILMEQQRKKILFNGDQEDNRHLKLIGKLYDQCQDTFVQFISFLSTQLTVEEIGRRLPAVESLLSTYNMAPEAAFALVRNIYGNSVQNKFEELRKIDKKEKNNSTSQKMLRYQEAVKTVMTPVVDQLDSSAWEELTPQFYSTFWTLSMYDLFVPHQAYEKQQQQLEQQIAGIEDSKEMNASKKKKEKERCVTLKEKLAEEEKKQQDHVKLVMARLEKDKDSWFTELHPSSFLRFGYSESVGSAKNIHVMAFLQACVLPRCCFTAIDAIFCAKFIHTLHNLKTPYFSSLICYDRIFSDVTYSVSSCTESEAHRYGRFLCACLESIMHWHSNKEIYEKECWSYPGFKTVYRAKGTTSGNKADHLDYENYRHVCHKWHFSLTKAMVACLESGNYIQIRNALVVLIKILPHYPRVSKFGQALERRVMKLCEEEKDKRQDLYALAMGYCGHLKSRRRTWIPEPEFHIKDTVGGAKNSTNATPTKPEPMDTSDSTPTIKKEPGVKAETSGERTTNGTDERAKSKSDRKTEKRESKQKDGRDSKEKKIKTEIKTEAKGDSKSSGNGGASPADANNPSGDASKKDGKKESSGKTKKTDKKKERKEDKTPKAEKHKEVGERTPKEERGLRTPREERIRDREDRTPRNEDRSQRSEDRIQRSDERGSREERLVKEDGAKGKEEKRKVEREEREKDRGHHSREWDRDKPTSSASSNSSHHASKHSVEASPKRGDDRDIKRRKVEMSGKDTSARCSPETWDSQEYRSPAHEGRDKDRDRSKDHRKRDHVEDIDFGEAAKRHRTGEDHWEHSPGHSHGSHVNGNGSQTVQSRSTSLDRHHSRSPRREPSPSHSTSASKKSRKESPERKEKERKSEKHSKKTKK